MIGTRIGLPMLSGGGGGAFPGRLASLDSGVAAIFAGAKGGVYDPAVVSSLWQDEARTTPVTALGQVVQAMSDLSGNGNHLGLNAGGGTGATKHPTLQSDGAHFWLAYDGVDDYLGTTAFDLAGVKSISAGVTFRKADDTEIGHPLYLQDRTNTLTMFRVYAPITSPANNFQVRGSGSSGNATLNGSENTGEDVAASGEFRIGTDGPYFAARRNGASLGSSTSSVGAASQWATCDFSLGGTTPQNEFNGRIYRGYLLGKNPSAGEITTLDTWLKAGAGL